MLHLPRAPHPFHTLLFVFFPSPPRHTNRILSISGMRVTLMRPLPWRIGDLGWRPALRINTGRRLGGVEAITIEFTWSPYLGFGRDRGYAAISIAGYQNSWVRDVEIVDADAGVQVLDSSLVTISGLLLRNSKPRWGHGRARLGARRSGAQRGAVGRKGTWRVVDAACSAAQAHGPCCMG